MFGDGFTLPLAFVDDFDPAQPLSFVVSLPQLCRLSHRCVTRKSQRRLRRLTDAVPKVGQVMNHWIGLRENL